MSAPSWSGSPTHRCSARPRRPLGVGRRNRQRAKAAKLSVPTSEYRDADGNVLVLRGSLPPAAPRAYAVLARRRRGGTPPAAGGGGGRGVAGGGAGGGGPPPTRRGDPV